MCLTLTNAATVLDHLDRVPPARGYTRTLHHIGHLSPGDLWCPVDGEYPRTAVRPNIPTVQPCDGRPRRAAATRSAFAGVSGGSSDGRPTTARTAGVCPGFASPGGAVVVIDGRDPAPLGARRGRTPSPTTV